MRSGPGPVPPATPRPSSSISHSRSPSASRTGCGIAAGSSNAFENATSAGSAAAAARWRPIQAAGRSGSFAARKAPWAIAPASETPARAAAAPSQRLDGPARRLDLVEGSLTRGWYPGAPGHGLPFDVPHPELAVVVIPSRMGAQRFPGKPLHLIAGVPLVVRVLRRALQARLADAVLVATDDERIASAVREAGGMAVMTSPELPSGTDRVRAAVEGTDATIVVNVQGDEPLMDPENVDRVIAYLAGHPEVPLATVARPIDDPATIADPNVVKVVRGDDGRALYFSRSPVPFRRNAEPGLPTWKHLGLYGYRRAALDAWTSLPPHPLERAESLEQLRALAAGLVMAVLPAVGDSIGVDTPADAEAVERILLNEAAAGETGGTSEAREAGGER